MWHTMQISFVRAGIKLPLAAQSSATKYHLGPTVAHRRTFFARAGRTPEPSHGQCCNTPQITHSASASVSVHLHQLFCEQFLH